MSDDTSSTPPPRKVGSLRDRIAQFEHKPDAPPPAPPKPSGIKKTWAWKEKQAEQPHPLVPAPAPPAASASSSSSVLPETESQATADESDDKSVHAGMSAADAKNAISQGGGLKARLAALQGSGLGAPIDQSPVPPPASGKPRVWKKAIVPHEPAPPKPEYISPEHDQPEASAEEDDAPVVAVDTAAGDHDDANPAEDDAEEERRRRAAIAARMARLGGARVGMPVVFGKKPVPTPVHKDSASDVSVAPPVPTKTTSTDETSSYRQESTSEEPETDATREADEEESSTEDDRYIPTPASPPRPRPPIPAARAWSTSPPTSPKPMMRPEIISQERDVLGEDKEHGAGGEGESESKEVGDQEVLGKERENYEEDHPDATTVPLPPSRKTTTTATSPPAISPQSSMPLPAMPKRAAPPRRKMPTPKPSSDSVPKVASSSSEVIGDAESSSKATGLDVGEPEPETPVPLSTEPEPPMEATSQVLPDVETVASPPTEEVAHGFGHQEDIREETKQSAADDATTRETENSTYDDKDMGKDSRVATGGDVSD